MATSETSICNLANGIIGIGRISDINGTTSVERDCKAIFAHARREVLGSYQWSFARKQALLARASASPIIDSNNGGYDYAYVLPSDCVAPVKLSDPKTEYSLVGDTIHCNLEEDVYLHYTADITDAAKFTEKFINALAHRLAAQLALMVKKDKKLSQETWDLFHALLPRLEQDDAQNDNNPIELSNPYVDARSV